ncbi:DMT family transporter, partial [Candidatus Omnitrophota bacterium]
IVLGKKYLVGTALISFVGIFMYQFFYMIGQNLTGSANIGIVYGFAPLLILVVSIIAKVERLSFFTASGVIIGCSGLFMILFQGGSFTVDKGSLLMLIAIACWSCYVVFGKRILDRYPPMLTTAWMLLFGSLYQLPLAVWQLPDQHWAELSHMNIFFVILSAVMSLYTGYTLFFYSVAKIGPAKAGVYTNLTPVFTVIFASLIRNETILFIHIIGLAVIILGIGITKIPPRSQSKGTAS